MPMVNGAPGADRLPNFATFDASKRSDDERQPLRPQAPPSTDATLIPTPSTRDNASDRYGPLPGRSSSQPPQFRPRDQFGGPPPSMPGSNGAMMMGPGMRPSDGSSQYRDRSAPAPGGRPYPSRGRGGYPPRAGYPGRGGGYGLRGPPPPQGYPGRGGFSTEMRGGYGSRGRGGMAPVAAMGAVGAGIAGGAMMAHGSRRPPPGYPPNGPEDGAERITPPDEYPLAMGPPVSMNTSQRYMDQNERRFDVRSPSVYTQAEEQQGAYGARAQSPGRDQMSYGSRVQSPSGNMRNPSPPPAMPPMPVNQAGEMGGTSTRDFGPQRSGSQDP
jgi:hypothetical protein